MDCRVQPGLREHKALWDYRVMWVQQASRESRAYKVRKVQLDSKVRKVQLVHRAFRAQQVLMVLLVVQARPA